MLVLGPPRESSQHKAAAIVTCVSRPGIAEEEEQTIFGRRQRCRLNGHCESRRAVGLLMPGPGDVLPCQLGRKGDIPGFSRLDRLQGDVWVRRDAVLTLVDDPTA